MSVLYSQSASPSRAWIEKGVAAVGITEQGLFIHWLDRSTMDRASERASELSICSTALPGRRCLLVLWSVR